MRIYWLNPPLSTKIIYPDVGWMNMNTVCKDYDWVQPIINWSEYKTIDDVVNNIIESNPKVLCVSCYTWNHVLIADICKKVIESLPQIIVIRGGPQLDKELKFDWYDYVCDAMSHGEEFLQAALPQIEEYGYIKNVEEVPWLLAKDFQYTKKNTKFKFPEESTIEHNFPYILECFTTAKDKNIKCGIQYETTRGCPYSCTYCEWGAGGTSAKLSEKPIDMILKDIESLSMIGVREFEFIDANFGILSRDIEIVEHLGKMKSQYGYPELVMMYGLAKVKVEKKEKILDAMFKHKLMNYYFMSVQSSSKVALDNVKRKDITLEENIAMAKRFIEKYGIVVKVELILGLPGSTIKDFYYEMDLIQETQGWDWPRAPFSILPQTEAADKFYQTLHKIKKVRVGVSENEEQDVTYISHDSVLSKYKSYQDIVISTTSYTTDEWKEMFFMNKAQKVIGPLIPNNLKASEVMQYLFKVISKKSWYKMFNDDMDNIVNGLKQDIDFMIINGKTVEDHIKGREDEIRTMVDEYSRTR